MGLLVDIVHSSPHFSNIIFSRLTSEYQVAWKYHFHSEKRSTLIGVCFVDWSITDLYAIMKNVISWWSGGWILLWRDIIFNGPIHLLYDSIRLGMEFCDSYFASIQSITHVTAEHTTKLLGWYVCSSGSTSKSNLSFLLSTSATSFCLLDWESHRFSQIPWNNPLPQKCICFLGLIQETIKKCIVCND